MKPLKKKIKRFEHILKEDEDWDYAFLLRLEKHKLRFMLDYFKNSKLVDNTYIVRDIKLCIKLLDIISYNDPENRSINKDSKQFPCYVNLRNIKRFVKDVNFIDKVESLYLKVNLIGEVRAEKAWNLYCIIRQYRMKTWWD